MLKPYLTRVVHDFLLALGIISLLLAVFLVGFLYYPEPSHRLMAGPDGYAEYARCLEEQRAVVGESVVAYRRSRGRNSAWKNAGKRASRAQTVGSTEYGHVRNTTRQQREAVSHARGGAPAAARALPADDAQERPAAGPACTLLRGGRRGLGVARDRDTRAADAANLPRAGSGRGAKRWIRAPILTTGR